MDYNLWALLILVIFVPLALVALAVVLDKGPRRGYALGALALGTLVLDLRALALSTGRKTWRSQVSRLSSSSADSLSRW